MKVSCTTYGFGTNKIMSLEIQQTTQNLLKKFLSYFKRSFYQHERKQSKKQFITLQNILGENLSKKGPLVIEKRENRKIKVKKQTN